MMGRFNAKELVKNPYVKTVNSYQITLTTEFRIRLFQAWRINLNMSAVKEILLENGFTADLAGGDFPQTVVNSFKLNGFPCYSVAETYSGKGYEEENPLILSGKFRLARNGLAVTAEFEEQLYQVWPEMSVEDALRSAGLNPIDVGHQRIQTLKKKFEERDKKNDGRKDPPAQTQKEDNGRASAVPIEPASGGKLWQNPYICMSNGVAALKDTFFNETYLIRERPLNELLGIYGISPDKFSDGGRRRAAAKLGMWMPTEERMEWDSREVLEIQERRAHLMNRAIQESFRRMKEYLKEADTAMRRKYCEWVRDLPRDHWGYYTTGKVLELSGIARSTYYKILSDETYGSRARRRADQDEEDIALIRQVLGYRGFKKGIRQVYMMMPDITGQQFSIHRIRRLMNKYGIRTNIRKPSKNRKAMRDMFERNQKANLLMRQFKQHRPNEVRLTDVTYLDYGDGLRAYGSASLDPVTGKLACFVVSGSNDLQLALDTLTELDAEHLKSDVILQSDQGILYMTDEFQTVARKLGLVQSMSRRGNCWDNAPQESFFGHFKDECPYKECKTLEELRDKIGQYRVYYNEERRMWDRNRMTPLEFEAWLLSLDEAAFAQYLAEEEARFQARKEESVRQAVERARAYKNMGKTEEMTNETCSEEQI